MVNFTITTSGPAHIGPGAHRARRIPLICLQIPLNSSEFLRIPLNSSELPARCGELQHTGPEIFFSAHKNYAPPENDGANGEIYARRARGEKKSSKKSHESGTESRKIGFLGYPPLEPLADRRA